MGDWALVIGCDQYGDPEACLRGAVRDALAVRSWLLDKWKGNVAKQNLLVLLGPSADGAQIPDGVSTEVPTRDAIVLAIELLLQRSAGDEGRLFVFYAGHGLTARVNGIDEPAIVPSDFTSRLTSKAIPIRSIVEQFATSSLDEQFFFFDACRNTPFEGEFTISPLDRPTRRDYSKLQPAQYGCFAASAGSVAQETGAIGDESGVFTEALLRGLSGDGTAKVWDTDYGSYVVRFDQLFEYMEADLIARYLHESGACDGQRSLAQRPRRLISAGSGNPVLVRVSDSEFIDSAYIKLLDVGQLDAHFMKVLGEPHGILPRYVDRGEGACSGKRLLWRPRGAAILAFVDDRSIVVQYVVQSCNPNFTATVPHLHKADGSSITLGQSTFEQIACDPSQRNCGYPANARWWYCEDFASGWHSSYRHIGVGDNYWTGEPGTESPYPGECSLDLMDVSNEACTDEAPLLRIRRSLIIRAFSVASGTSESLAVIPSDDLISEY